MHVISHETVFLQAYGSSLYKSYTYLYKYFERIFYMHVEYHINFSEKIFVDSVESWSYQSWQFSLWLVGMCLAFNISCNSSYSLRSHEDGLGTIPCARVHSQWSSALIYIENKKYNFIFFSFYPFLIQQFMKTIYQIHVHDCMLFISILCKCIL